MNTKIMKHTRCNLRLALGAFRTRTFLFILLAVAVIVCGYVRESEWMMVAGDGILFTVGAFILYRSLSEQPIP